MRLLLELAATAENEADLDDPAGLVAGIRIGNVFDDFHDPRRVSTSSSAIRRTCRPRNSCNPGRSRSIGRRAVPDVYAWVLERSAELLRSGGRCGMIVPLSLGFSAAFAACRGAAVRRLWRQLVRVVRPHSRRPVCRRHPRAEHDPHRTQNGAARTAIHHCLHRWFEAERPHLLQTLQYVPFDPDCWRQRVPKLNTPALARALEDCLRRTPGCPSPKRQRGMTASLAYALGSERTPHVLHYKKTAYNWLTFCRRLPACFDAADRPAEQTQFDVLYFAEAEQRATWPSCC